MNRLTIQILPMAEVLLVDRESISAGFSIDYFDLAYSAVEAGEFYILTCSCGDAGCAGLFEPIKVRHSLELITWRITEPAPERIFTFKKKEYASEVSRALKEAVLINATLPEDEKLGPYGITQSDFEKLSEIINT